MDHKTPVNRLLARYHIERDIASDLSTPSYFSSAERDRAERHAKQEARAAEALAAYRAAYDALPDTFTLGPKRPFAGSSFAGSSGWSRTVTVGEPRQDQPQHVYTVTVSAGRRVRIPYKPRGTYGNEWWGGVRSAANEQFFYDRVNGSIGARGLLIAAGIIKRKGGGS